MSAEPTGPDNPALSKSFDSVYVELTDANGLPERLRLAWLYVCISYVVNMLSGHAQQSLGLRKQISFLRDCIENDQTESNQIKLALAELESKFEIAENDGFGPEPILMIHSALQVAKGVQEGVSSALSQAAVVFSCCKLWQQGVADSNPAIPRDYVMGLELVYLTACLELLHALRSRPTEQTGVPNLGEIHTELLPQAILRKCRRPPPPSER